MKVYLVPNGRHLDTQMWIVGEQRPAGVRMRSGYDPRVGSNRASARSEQVGEQGEVALQRSNVKGFNQVKVVLIVGEGVARAARDAEISNMGRD